MSRKKDDPQPTPDPVPEQPQEQPTPDPVPEQPQEQPTPDPVPEQPARRHTPEAGVKDYGISLDEISRRSRGGR